MKKFLSTVAVGALALAGPVLAQETTTGTSTTQMTPTSSAMICGPSTASMTTTDTTASTSTTTGTSTGTDTTASTGTSTDTTASTGADTTTGTAGTSTDTTASTTGTAAGTSGASTTTLGLSADNQMIEQSARTALSNVDANLGKLAGFTPDVICLVDLNIVSTAQALARARLSVPENLAPNVSVSSATRFHAN